MTKSLRNIALIVSLGTLLSKAGGLLRQLVIAGAFGVGEAYDAYNYAYVLPGFFLILLGGINGPFHNSMVSVLSSRSKNESAYIISSLNNIVSIFLVLITVIIYCGANRIIHIIAPNLPLETHILAVHQLKIMSPITLFSGLIGIGFGTLNANNEFLIPSIAPILSSVTIIATAGYVWINNTNIVSQTLDTGLRSGILLASATSLGALLQLLVQIPPLLRKRLLRLKLVFDYKNKGVKDVLKILGPATFSSGMLQINVFTDLFFASGIKAAAAGLGYANFLIQAPLGLISSTLIIPLLPIYSNLSKLEDKSQLISKIRQGIILSFASMVSLGVLFITMGEPIVSLIYARGAFEKGAVNLVSSLLIAYGLGMPFYLCRDLLVRIFYALGDAKTPFKLSVIGVFTNAIFDWLLIGGPTPWGNQSPFSFGAQGLVLATVVVNLITCVLLIRKLNLVLGHMPLKNWSIDLFKIIFAGLVSALATIFLRSFLEWPNNFTANLIKVTICCLSSILIFTSFGTILGVKEIKSTFLSLYNKIISF
tara:strand:+ start:31 stop:1641 length:1611 start_codon:yes stop_codon:yes gene_type:complete